MFYSGHLIEERRVEIGPEMWCEREMCSIIFAITHLFSPNLLLAHIFGIDEGQRYINEGMVVVSGV